MKTFRLSVVTFLSFFMVSCGGGKEAPNAARDANVYRLIGLLDSEDADAAKTSAAVLGALKCEEAIPALIRAVKSKNVGLSLIAKKALVNIGPKAAEKLVKEDSNIIEKAYTVFEDIGEPAVPFVVEELKITMNTDRKFYLLMVFTFMGTKAASALPALEEMLEAEENPAMHTLIASTIEDVKHGKSAVGMRKDTFDSRQTELDKKVADLQRETAALGDEIINPKMNINSPDADSFMELWGDKPKEALLKLTSMFKEEPRKKATALVCMCRFCEKDPINKISMLPHIRMGLKDDITIIQALSAAIMVKIGEEKEAVPVALHILKSTFETIELRFVLGALLEGKVVVIDENAIKRLVSIARTDNPEFNVIAAFILINSGVCEDIVASLFGSRLGSEDEQERGSAIAVLWKMGPKAKPAAAYMKAAYLRETNPEFKTNLNLAIAALGKVEDSVETVLVDFDDPVRMVWVVASLKMKDFDSAGRRKLVKPLLERWETANADKRNIIISALCHFDADAEEAYPFLIEHLKVSLKDGNYDNVFLIVGVLGKIGKPEATPLIVAALKSGNENAALAASVALRNMGMKANSAIPDILKMAEDPQTCEDTLRLLASLGPLQTEEQAETVIKLMENQKVAFSALHALTESASTKAVGPLLKQLNTPNQFTRHVYIMCLGKLGRIDSRVVPALQAALTGEKDEKMVEYLKEAIRQTTLTKEDEKRELVDSWLKDLENESKDTRRLAIFLLAGEKEPRIVPALQAARKREKDKELVKEIDDTLLLIEAQ